MFSRRKEAQCLHNVIEKNCLCQEPSQFSSAVLMVIVQASGGGCAEHGRANVTSRWRGGGHPLLFIQMISTDRRELIDQIHGGQSAETAWQR